MRRLLRAFHPSMRALLLVATVACGHGVEPRDPAVQALFRLRLDAKQGTTQTEFAGILAGAGGDVACSGDVDQTELGVYGRSCSGTIPLAGCPSAIGAGFVRNAFGDAIPHLTYLRVDAPSPGDCGPRVDPRRVPFEQPPPPWVATLAAQFERELGVATVTGADHRWIHREQAITLHDAQLEPCPGLERCPSFVTIMLDGTTSQRITASRTRSDSR